MATTTVDNSKSGDDLNASSGLLAKYGLIALVLAIITNLIVSNIGIAALDLSEKMVSGPFGPLGAIAIVINTLVATLGATIVYGILTRYSARPNRTFTIVAAVVLLLSFAMFSAPDLAGAPIELFTILTAMHVVSAVVIVSCLTRVKSSVNNANAN